jgi:hypothetical protein
VRAIAGAAADSKEEQPSDIPLDTGEQIGHFLNRDGIQFIDDLCGFFEMLLSVAHTVSLAEK